MGIAESKPEVICGANCPICGIGICTRAPHDFASGHVHPSAEGKHSWRAVTEEDELKQQLKAVQQQLKNQKVEDAKIEDKPEVTPVISSDTPKIETETERLLRQSKELLENLPKKV